MEPITTISGWLASHGVSANAVTLGNHVNGIVSGQGSPQGFTFTDNGILGQTLTMGGQPYSLRPDLISQGPLGHSFSVFHGLDKIGTIGRSALTGGVQFSGNMSPQLGTVLGTSLRAKDLL